jgi:hypothetical protein
VIVIYSSRVGERRGRSIELPKFGQLSPADSDALYSLRAIATDTGITPTFRLPGSTVLIIPTFRLPGSTVLCASKATIREAWHRYQAEWRDKHPIDIEEKLRLSHTENPSAFGNLKARFC